MELNCALNIKLVIFYLSYPSLFFFHSLLLSLILLLFFTFDFFRCVPCAHVATALWSLLILVKDGWGGIQVNLARDRIPTVNLQFLKLVKVVHISLLLKVDFVQVFVYISYHPYVFICIFRLLGVICMLLVCIRMLPFCIRLLLVGTPKINVRKSVIRVQSCCFGNQSKPIAFLPFSSPWPSSLRQLLNLEV